MTTTDVMPIYFAVLLSSAFMLIQGVEELQLRRALSNARQRRLQRRAALLVAHDGMSAAPVVSREQILQTGLTGLFALLMALWLAVQLHRMPTMQAADLLSLRVCLAGSVLFLGRTALQLVRSHTQANAGVR